MGGRTPASVPIPVLVERRGLGNRAFTHGSEDPCTGETGKKGSDYGARWVNRG